MSTMGRFDDACAYCGGLGDPSERSNHRLNCVFGDTVEALDELRIAIDAQSAKHDALQDSNEKLLVRVASLEATCNALCEQLGVGLVPDSTDALESLLRKAIELARCADVDGWDYSDDAIIARILASGGKA